MSDNKRAKYNWTTQNYIRYVENATNPTLKEFQKVELQYMLSISSPATKTFIDLGAGYGRILPHITPRVKNLIALEINDDTITELKRRSKLYKNVTAIHGDGNNLYNLLKGLPVESPLVFSLQNTLGTWEGDYKDGLKEMVKTAKGYKGEIIISLFIQEGLKNYGIDMYRSISKLVGEPDLKKTDFEKGIFRSKTDYLSKWWTKNEREGIKKILGGKIVKEILYPAFYILHLSYK